LAGLRIAEKKEEASKRCQQFPAGWNFIPEIDKTRSNPLNFDPEDLEPDQQEPAILWNMQEKEAFLSSIRLLLTKDFQCLRSRIRKKIQLQTDIK
jgi:hypothetical protein